MFSVAIGNGWREKTGVKIKYVISDWNKKKMRAGWEKSEVLDKIEKTCKTWNLRETDLKFTH